jgi:hypothetical protein
MGRAFSEFRILPAIWGGAFWGSMIAGPLAAAPAKRFRVFKRVQKTLIFFEFCDM